MLCNRSPSLLGHAAKWDARPATVFDRMASEHVLRVTAIMTRFARP